MRCVIFDYLEKLAEGWGKRKAIEFLVSADVLAHGDVTHESSDRRDGYVKLYKRLKHRLHFPDKLPHVDGFCVTGSLAYVITQALKRPNSNYEKIFDDILNLEMRSNSLPLYEKIVLSLVDKVGLFPDGTGRVCLDESISKGL